MSFGALFFLLAAARPAGLAPDAQLRLRRIASRFALALALTQVLVLATTSAELMGSSGQGLRDLFSASYFVAGSIFVVASIALFISLRAAKSLLPGVLAAVIALGASVSLSH